MNSFGHFQTVWEMMKRWCAVWTECFLQCLRVVFRWTQVDRSWFVCFSCKNKTSHMLGFIFRMFKVRSECRGLPILEWRSDLSWLGRGCSSVYLWNEVVGRYLEFEFVTSAVHCRWDLGHTAEGHSGLCRAVDGPSVTFTMWVKLIWVYSDLLTLAFACLLAALMTLCDCFLIINSPLMWFKISVQPTVLDGDKANTPKRFSTGVLSGSLSLLLYLLFPMSLIV